MFDLFLFFVGFGLGYGLYYLSYRDISSAYKKLEGRLEALVEKFHSKL